MAFMLFVQLLRSSGTIEVLSSLFQPLIQSLHLPIDIFILGFLRPISANASLSFLYSFYEVFGVDHPLSLLASLIQSGSDTTMYVVALYFSSIKMKDYSLCFMGWFNNEFPFGCLCYYDLFKNVCLI